MLKKILSFRKKNKPPRVFLGFTEIAGYYKNLCEGFNLLEVDACFVSYMPHKFSYQNHKDDIIIVKIISYLLNVLNTKQLSLLKSISFKLLILVCECILFIWAICNFDIFIFGAATSFFSLTPFVGKIKLIHRELPILKLFRKKVIFMFHGSDERPPYIDGNFQDYEVDILAKITKNCSEKIQYIERFADYMISHPPSSQFHKRKMIQCFSMGIPYHPYQNIRSGNNGLKSDVITILHSPSHPIIKGTQIIRDTINELKNQGYSIEYIEIIDKPNHEVIEAIQKADFIIDQLYSDTPMAGFVTEAASFAKPAIVTGYELEYFVSALTTDIYPPSLIGKPNQLKDLIILLIENKQLRLDLGAKAYNFIQSKWSPEQVAERFLKLAKDEAIPVSWYFDPNEFNYTFGVGINSDKRRQILRKLHAFGGEQVFQLQDKQHLLKILMSEITNKNDFTKSREVSFI
jgi:glycosyltransferase involved in cell wall biosynthesis